MLACKVVEHWLRIVKGDIGNTTPAQSNSTDQASRSNPEMVSSSDTVSSAASNYDPDVASADDDSMRKSVEDQSIQEQIVKNCVGDNDVKNDTSEGSSDEKLPVYKITIRDGKKVLAEISGDRRSSTEANEEEGSTGTDDVNQEDYEPLPEELEEEDDDDLIKPVKIKKKPPAKKQNKQNIVRKPAKVTNSNKKDRDSTDSASSTGKSVNKQIPKKGKNDLQKTNLKNKAETNSPKAKESGMGNIKNNVVVNKDSGELLNSKPKEKMSLSLKKKNNAVSSKDKTKSDKSEEKEKNLFYVNDTLTEKEKETLSKFITPPISKVGKIPKKTSLSKEEKQSEEKNRTLKDDKPDLKKSFDMKKPEIKRPEKKISMSVEPKKNIPSDNRPKTVKTFHSKFRSTGLEEEIKPPPPRPVQKKLPPLIPPVMGVPEKKLGKRASPPPEVVVPEKRPKAESPQEEKKSVDKLGGIKLIPPKPKRKSYLHVSFFHFTNGFVFTRDKPSHDDNVKVSPFKLKNVLQYKLSHLYYNNRTLKFVSLPVV